MQRFMFLLIVVYASILFSQEKGVFHGNIVSLKGEVIPGANIVVTGTKIGTVSKIDGSFELKLFAGTYKITISLLGYRTVKEEILISENSAVSRVFSLSEDIIGSNEVVIIGNRNSNRTIVNSPVPIDIIGAKEIASNGYTQTTQILRALVPSFNAPQPSLVDGTDHVRPATLRGLGPDQVLVLVNGKRRHTSALVHTNGTVGRGATGVDLNAIPVSAIDRVEVLRDGASAQYGSDAISGVINIILKEKTGIDAGASYGQYLSSASPGYTTSEGNRAVETTNFASGTYDGLRWDADGKKKSLHYSDGQTINAHLGYGTEIGDGKIYISGEYGTKGGTSRGGIDPRVQYSAGDPRELSFNRDTHKFGDGEINDGSIFFNGSYPIQENISIYAFGGYSHRAGKAAGFYRRSNDPLGNVPAIYPDGFLPYIETGINDLSVSGGLKGSFGEWTYDLSETYGSNELEFRVTNSLNASYWTKSPTEFTAGTLVSKQATTNFDIFRSWNIGTEFPLNTSFGAEFRNENYQIKAGQPESYLRGDSTSKAIGSQVFPGFLPSNIVNQSRNNIGVYTDVDHNIFQQWLVSVAARFENYSDFGSTTTAKISSRYDIAYGLSVRGAASTGFRAPSLAQEYFSTTQTVFVNGVPNEVGTFPVSSPVAKSLGAKDLKAEKSVNYSTGITYNFDDISLTVDAYQISITDRIVLTETFNDASVKTYLLNLGVNATAGRFFTNAIHTKTQGVDITGHYGIDLDAVGKLILTTAINFNKTEITNKSSIVTPAALQTVTTIPLFGRIEQGRTEHGQPSSTYTLLANYQNQDFDGFIRGVRYGEITSYGSITDLTLDQTYSVKWLFDSEVGYHGLSNIGIAVGVNNIFDVYPDKVLKANSANGRLPYNAFSPFGFNGRFVYTRASVTI